jgi:hypothetical protein
MQTVENEGVAMKTAATQYQVMTVGLVLTMIAVTCSFAPTRTEEPAHITVSQYCAPLDESLDAHRFYCRNGA